MNKLLCMAVDGDSIIEGNFDSIEKTWEYANDLGSRWFFYPFRFVVSKSGKTIKDAPELLEWAIGKRVKTVASLFKIASAKPENQNMDAEQFIFAI